MMMSLPNTGSAPATAVETAVRLDRRAFIGSALGVALTLGGCGETADDAGNARELLVVDTPHPLSFEPSSTGRIYTQMGVAETLIDADAQGRTRPGLATAWTTSDDGLEWRFTLRDKALFHDGTAVTPELAARALNRARNRPGVFSFVSAESIDADGSELRIRLKEKSALMLAVLSNFGTQILAPASFDREDRAIWVVGTGPYKMRAVTEQELTVDFWTGWPGTAPEVRAARYLSAGRAETRGVLAESGQADIVMNLDTATEARLRNRANMSVVSVPGPRTTYIKVNAAHPFLSDVKARRALSLAIDREGIARGLLGNPDRVARQLLPPFVGEWHQEDLPPLRTDVEEARRLFAEVGWAPGTDGILMKDGQRFRLDLLTHTVTPELQLIAAALQEQLGNAGIEISVRIGRTADTPQGHNDGTLELALVNRSFMLVSEPTGALLQDYGGGGGEQGAMNWENEGVAAALRELADGTDADRTKILRRHVVQALQDELPVIPIVHNPRTAAINSRIENAVVDPLERTYGLPQVRWRRQ